MEFWWNNSERLKFKNLEVVPVPLCPPQIPQWVAKNWTQA